MCSSLFRRPAPKAQLSLPAWDSSDSFGDVHTTPSPDLVIPSKPDLLFFRADFSGVTLQGTYTPTDTASIKANGGCTITSGPWNGLFIPYINGANTTPPTMLMTPQLVLYPRKVQDAALTEHAWRNYDRIIWSGTDPWENPPISIQQAKDWGTYVKSWGFWNCIWKGIPDANDPDWPALVDADLCNFAVFGEEVDSKVTAEQYAASLNVVRHGPLNGVPTGAHFTAGARGGYPIDGPRDTFLAGGATGSWADYNGWLHLMLQSNQNHSAGRQGACTVYARQRLVGAPDSRIVLFETMASEKLVGQCSEEYGCLRSLELLYAQPGPTSGGIGDGLRYPNGGWV